MKTADRRPKSKLSENRPAVKYAVIALVVVIAAVVVVQLVPGGTENTTAAGFAVDLSNPVSVDGATWSGTTLTFNNPEADGNTYTLTGGGGLARNIIIPTDVTTTLIIININIAGRIELQGTADVTLLMEGNNTIRGSIFVPSTAKITIDSASDSGSSDGSLTVSSTTNNCAGIGGASYGTGGTITINGGTVTATGGGAAAGIGGGYGGTGGIITINGGTVTATGGTYGPGIGGGEASGVAGGGNITINGGTVTAIGGGAAAGIGAGWSAAGGNITINNGIVTAYGSGNTTYGSGAGIGGGGGNGGAGGNITINGGTVTATGGSTNNNNGGAGIGGGNAGAGCNFTIGSDANVKAYSRGPASAIQAASVRPESTGYYVNAYFSAAISTSLTTTLAVYPSGDLSTPLATLGLPANYRYFALQTPGTTSPSDPIIYIMQPDGLQQLLRNDNSRPEMPAWGSTTGPGITLVKMGSFIEAIMHEMYVDISDPSVTIQSDTFAYVPEGSNYNRGIPIIPGYIPVGYKLNSAPSNSSDYIKGDPDIQVDDGTKGIIYLVYKVSQYWMEIDLSNSDGSLTNTAFNEIYQYSGTTLTIKQDAPASAENPQYYIWQSGTTAVTNIIVNTEVITNIMIGGIAMNGPITLAGTADVTLWLLGNSRTAGIIVPSTAAITIDSAINPGSSNGSLTAIAVTAGNAGIGGAVNAVCGTITINGGTVTATGGGTTSSGAGIGDGGGAPAAGSSSNITINGGTVIATGGGTTNGGAGIGGGGAATASAGGNIFINGGTVIATGGGTTNGGAGIGGGGGSTTGGAGGNIAIKGGTVVATGGGTTVATTGSGIGGGGRSATDAGAVLTISIDADVKAYSRGTLPAINAASIDSASTGYYLNAYYAASVSNTQATTIGIYARGDMSARLNTLTLPTGYVSFAFQIQGYADPLVFNAYIDSASGLQLIQRSDNNSADIPTWGMAGVPGSTLVKTGSTISAIMYVTFVNLSAPSVWIQDDAYFYIPTGRNYGTTVQFIEGYRLVGYKLDSAPANSSDYTKGNPSEIPVEAGSTMAIYFVYEESPYWMEIDLSNSDGSLTYAAYNAMYQYSGTTLTFKEDAPQSENTYAYRIWQSGTTLVTAITVNTGVNTNITIDGITINGPITFTGTANVTLLLSGNSTIWNSIFVPPTATLTIDSASGTGSNDGSLTASSTAVGNAGIGGNNVVATRNAGTIVINGGTVTATGGRDSAGIGGGYISAGGTGGTTIINGGTVTAIGGSYGAGIGGGDGGTGGNITINGGNVTAIGSGSYGAGIGGGYRAAGGNITIIGGTVNAFSSYYGTGIGGGSGGAGCNLTIGSGADVKAYSRDTYAIQAISVGSESTGYYVNAYFSAAISSQPTTLAVYQKGELSASSATLELPAGYRSFAFQVSGTASPLDFNVYIVRPDGLQQLLRNDNSSPQIPSWGLSTGPSSVQVKGGNSNIGSIVQEVYIDKNNLLTPIQSDTFTYLIGDSKYSKAIPFVSGYDSVGYKLDSPPDNPDDYIPGSPSDIAVDFYTTRTVYLVYEEPIWKGIDLSNSDGSLTNSNWSNYYTYSGTTLTIKQDAPSSDKAYAYLLWQSGTTAVTNIVVNTGVTTDITIDGIAMNGRITLNGTANVMLLLSGDSSTASIIVPSAAAITIDSASESGSSDGSLTVSGAAGAGIGGSNVSATRDAGTIIIDGGTVNATGGNGGAGIGGAWVSGTTGGAGGNITINGGVVNATGAAYGAGIGGSDAGAGGNITINGGTVTAIGGRSGAGIGGGYQGTGGTTTINGGIVTAVGGDTGAGIGGGYQRAGGTVIINGGNVTATAGPGAAGIGGGSGGSGSAGCNFTIGSEANVKAYSRDSAIQASSIGSESTGYYVNAYLSAAISYSQTTTIEVYAKGDLTAPLATLQLPADYRWFAFQVQGTTSPSDFNIYIVQPYGLQQLLRNDNSSPEIPSRGLTTGPGSVQVKMGNTISGIVREVYVDRNSPSTPIQSDTFSYLINGNNYSRSLPAIPSYLTIGYKLDSPPDNPDDYTAGNPSDIAVDFCTTRTIYLVYEEPVWKGIDLSNSDGSLTDSVWSNYYTYSGTTLTIKQDAPASAENQFYYIWQSGTTAVTNIVVNTGVTTDIMIDGIAMNGRITLNGTANVMLLLSGDSRTAGIVVPSTATIAIDSASELGSGNGSLTVSGVASGFAGIGGQSGAGGNITIDGGTVAVTGGANSAGIGGSSGAGGNITINGGVVTAIGGTNSAGIGGGNNAAGGNITINGGVVTAIGGTNSAGIGGGNGNSGTGGTIIIIGGTVTATGNGNAAGIGAGSGTGAGATLTIGSDANIKAYSTGTLPAIFAADVTATSTGYYVNAFFAQAVSGNLSVYSAGDTSSLLATLTLPTGCRGFAFQLPGSVSYSSYNIFTQTPGVGVLRTDDDSTFIYSVNSTEGYDSHFGIRGALPVKTGNFIEVTLDSSEPDGTSVSGATFTYTVAGGTPQVYTGPFSVTGASSLIVTVSPPAGYEFLRWQDSPISIAGTSQSAQAISMTAYSSLQSVTLTAMLTTAGDRITVALTSDPAGAVLNYTIGATGQQTYAGPFWMGRSETLSVGAAATNTVTGNAFMRWQSSSGTVWYSSTVSDIPLPLSPVTTAEFTAAYSDPEDAVTISLDKIGGASATFSYTVDNVPYSYTGPFTVLKTDTVAVSVSGYGAYQFIRWYDSDGSIVSNTAASGTLDLSEYGSNVTFSAYLVDPATGVTLTLNSNPASSGTFQYRLSGTVSWIGYTAPVTLNPGETVDVHATPVSGYAFRFWNDSTLTDTRSVTVGVNTALTAYFLATDVSNLTTITLASSPAGAGTFTWQLPGMVAPVAYTSPFQINKTDNLTITTAPAAGYTFTMWDDSSTSATRNVGSNATDKEYDAYFLSNNVAERFTLTLNLYPASSGTFQYNLTGTTAWIGYSTPITLNKGDEVEVHAVPASGYDFSFWNDQTTADMRSVTVNANTTLTAYFLANTAANTATITLASSPAGAGTFTWQLPGMAAPVAYTVPFAINKTDNLTITATPVAGYTFTMWDNSSTSAVRNIGANAADKTYTAYFLSSVPTNTATINLTSSPAGAGTFTWQLPGMAAPVPYTAPFIINKTDDLTITAIPAAGYTFTMWDDSSTAVARNVGTNATDMGYTAYFLANTTANRATITLTSSPAGAGTFTWQLPGMAAPVPYTAPFIINKTDDLTITAIPAAGYTFKMWDDSSTAVARNVGTNATDMRYTAYFLSDVPANTVTLTLNSSPASAGTLQYRLTGTAAWNNYTTPVTLNTGDSVDVQATAASGYAFRFWDDAGTNSARTVTVNANTTLTAYFIANTSTDTVTITLSSSPAGAGTFTWQLPGMAAPVAYKGPFTINKIDDLTIAAAPAAGYTFTMWDDSSTSATRNVGANAADMRYTAYFLSDVPANTVTLTLNSSPASAGTLQYRLTGTATWNDYTAPVTMNAGDSVDVKATAASGNDFRFWNDQTTADTRTVTVSANTTLTAYFLSNITANTATITLASSPAGAGTFTWQLPGMAAPVPYIAPFTINKTDDLTITAATAAGYAFKMWDDSTMAVIRNVGMNATDMGYTAYFLSNVPTDTVTLTLNSSPASAGTFQYRLTGTAAWSNYTVPVILNAGDSVDVQATAASGYDFRYWNDQMTADTRTVIVNANTALTAYFLADTSTDTVTITLASSPAGAGTFTWQLPGMAMPVPYTVPFVINKADDLTITSIPAAGYTFKMWDDSSTAVTRNVGTNAADMSYTAYFLSDVPTNTVTLTLNSSPASAGTLQYRLDGTTSWNGYSMPVTLNAGDAVDIRAVPASGYDFRSWNDLTTDDTRTVTVSANTTFTAYFLSDVITNTATITLTSSPAGAGTFTWQLPGMTVPVAYTAPFTINKTDNLTITAAPTADYTFTMWDDSSTSASRHVGVNTADAEYTAYFLSNIPGNTATLTLNSSPASAGTFQYRLDGTTSWIGYSTPVTLNAGDTVDIRAIQATGYDFRFWNDQTTADMRTVTVSANTTLTAYFLANTTANTVTITLASSPAGAGTFTWQLPGMATPVAYTMPFTINKTDNLTITAVPASDYTFLMWDDSSTVAERNAGTNTANTEYTAYFLSDVPSNTVTLTLNSSPASAGTFQYRLDGTISWIGYSTPVTLNIGDTVDIRAVPATGYDFRFWNDQMTADTRAVTVSADTTLSAYFLASASTSTVTITLASDPAGAGTFTWQLPGMVAPVAYTVPFTINKTDNLTITSTPATNYTFTMWDDSSTSVTRNVGTNSADKTYTAYFLSDVPTNTALITLTSSPAGAGTFTWKLDGMSASVPYTVPFYINNTDDLTITATAAAGYNFQMWDDSSTSLTRNVGTNSAETEYTAYFLSSSGTVTLTLNADPASAGEFQYKLDGMSTWIDYTGPAPLNAGDVVDVQATEVFGYTFQMWDDASTSAVRTVTVSADTTLTAYFLSDVPTNTVEITLVSSPAGAGIFTWQLAGMSVAVPYTGPFMINDSDNLTITVAAAADYTFQRWDDSSAALTRNVGMNAANLTYTAFFLSDVPTNTVTLTLDSYPASAGTFQYKLSGTTSWIGYSTSITLNKGDSVDIRAVPASGYDFEFWGDLTSTAERTVTVSADAVLTAYFLANNAANTAVITLTSSPAGAGTFSWELPGMAAPVPYTVPFEINKTDSLMIIVSSTSGYTFKMWDDSSTSTARNVGTHSEDAEYTAYFLGSAGTVTLTLNAYLASSGTFQYRLDGTTSWIGYSKPVTLNTEDEVDVRAIPASGYDFALWDDSTTADTRTVTVSANTTLTAYFLAADASDQVTITLTSGTAGAGTFSWELPGMAEAIPYTVPFEINKTDDLTIIATPASGYTFLMWEDSSTATTRHVGTHNDDTEYTAYFLSDTPTNEATLTLNASPASFGTFQYRLDGTTAWIGYSTPIALNVGDAVDIRVVTVPGYEFRFWDDASASETRTVTMEANTTLTAYFLTTNISNEVMVTLTSDPAGAGTFSWQLAGMSESVPYTVPFYINKTDDLTINASSAPGYTFQVWDNASMAATRNVGINSVDKVYTAHFLSDVPTNTALITLASDPAGAGTFSWQLDGMSASVPYTVPFYINKTDDLTITVAATAGYAFRMWDDASTTVTRNVGTNAADMTYTAYFLSNTSTDRVMITLTSSPAGAGTFSWQLDGMMSSVPYTVPFVINKTDDLIITTAAASDYTFLMWDDSSTSMTRDIGANSTNMTYTAFFLSSVPTNTVTLTLNSDPLPAGTLQYKLTGTTTWIDYTADVTLNTGDKVDIQATADTGYTFKFWDDASTSTARTFTVNTNTTLTAYFLSDNSADTVTITMTSSPAGAGSFTWQLAGMTSSFPYTAPFVVNKTDDLTITATATYGYTFRMWDDSSMSLARNVGTNSSNKEFTAYFISSYEMVSLTLGSSPSLSGIYQYKLTGTTVWTNYTVPVAMNPGDSVDVQVTADAGYTFKFWEDAGTSTSRTVTINTDMTLTAYFLSDDTADQAMITIASSPADAGTFTWQLPGMSAPVPYTIPFAVNKADSLVINASPAAGYSFVMWDNSSTVAERNVGLNSADMTYTAFFISVNSAAQSTLTLSSDPAVAGTFQYRLTGTTSWNNYTASVAFNTGDSVDIRAVPAAGYGFRFWNDSVTSVDRTLTIDTDTVLTAYFISTADMVTITLATSPADTGTFSWELPGMDAPVAYTGPFMINKADDLTITEIPTPGYSFVMWDDSSTASTRNVGANSANMTYTAFFLSDNPTDRATLTLSSDPAASGTFQYRLTGTASWIGYSGPVTLNSGDSVDVHATSAFGYGFRFWNDSNANDTRTVTVSANTTLTAFFLATNVSNTVTITLTSSPAGAGTFSWQLSGMSVPIPYTTPFQVNKTDNLTIIEAPVTGHTFQMWDDSSTTATRNVGTNSANASYTAFFLSDNPADGVTLTLNSDPASYGTFQYRLTGTSSWIGYSSPIAINVGNQVDILAIPAAGSEFRFWNDADTNEEKIVTVNSDTTLTAYFLSTNSSETALITINSGQAGAGTFSWQVKGMTTSIPYTAPFETNKADELIITATPAAGYTFLVWDNGSTSMTRDAGVSHSDTVYTGYFLSTSAENTVTISLASSPAGAGTFSWQLPGMTIPVPYTVPFTINKTDDLMISTSPTVGYTFLMWDDSSTATARNVGPNSADARYTAFLLGSLGTVTLTLDSYPALSGTFQYKLVGTVLWKDYTAPVTLNAGDSVDVQAIEGPGYAFRFWNDSGMNAVKALTVSANTTLTAYFLATDSGNKVTITLAASPVGAGTFTWQLPGMTSPASYAAPFEINKTDDLTINVTATSGHTFTMWDNSSPAVSRHVGSSSADTTYTAYFLSNAVSSKVTITLASSPAGMGTFTWQLQGMTAPVPYTVPFTINNTDILTITAAPASDHTFLMWDDSSTAATRNVGTNAANATYTAYFLTDDPSEQVTLTLDAYSASAAFQYKLTGTLEWFDYTSPVTLNEGDSVDIQTTALGYSFMFWNDANANSMRTFTVNENTTLTAYFLTDNPADKVQITLNTSPVSTGVLSWQLPGMTAFMDYTAPFYIGAADDLILSAAPGAGYSFVMWDNSSAAATRDVGTQAEDATYTAFYLTDNQAMRATLIMESYSTPLGTFQYKLTGTSDWIDYTGPVDVNIGDSVDIQTEAAGYSFMFWCDAVTTDERTVTVGLDNSRDVFYAYFLADDTADTIMITLDSDPTDAGTFTWQLPEMTSVIQYEGPFEINMTDDLTITSLPERGYAFTMWEDSSTSATRYIGLNSDDAEYTAYFELLPVYQITASAGQNGSVDPDGSVDVIQGESQTFTFTPSSGFAVSAVFIDGERISGTPDSYTFDNVTGDHDIRVEFAMSQSSLYMITATSDSGSSISPSGTVTVQKGGSMTFNFTANAGCFLTAVTVDGNDLSQSDMALGSYTFTNVTANHTIYVNSTSDTILLTINVVEGKGYAEYRVNGGAFMIYTSSVYVPADADITVRAVAADGYAFSGWGDSGSLYKTSDYTMFGQATSVSLDLHFSTGSGGPSGNGDSIFLWVAAVAAVMLLMAVGLPMWYYGIFLPARGRKGM